MKYQRMTKHSDLGTLHADDINGNEQPLCELTAVDTDNLIGRLCELEDKIESGELISTKEVGDTEIEFFVKHNDKVRKETVQQVLIQASKIMNSISWSHYDDGKAVRVLEKIAEAYGVELFENFDKLENCNE